MSSELTVFDPANYLTLTSPEDVQEMLESNFGGDGISERDLIAVKTPSGGSTTWSFESANGAEECKEIVGILALHQPGGVLWPSEDLGEKQKPLIRTDDRVHGYKVGDDYGDLDEEVVESFRLDSGLYDWQAMAGKGVTDGCPFGFGSAKGGRGAGKRVDEYRTLCIIREGEFLPLMIRAKAGSELSVSKFLKQLPGIPYYRAVVGVSLVKIDAKGSTPAYSQIKLRLVGKLTKEQGLVIKQNYTEPLKEASKNLGLDRDGDDL